MTIDDDHQCQQNIFTSNIHQSLEETSLIGVCNLTRRSQKMSTAVETSCHPYNRKKKDAGNPGTESKTSPSKCMHLATVAVAPEKAS